MRVAYFPQIPECDLHVTNRCMAHCDHCIYSSGRAYEDELTAAEILELFEGLRNLGCEEVHLTGGEPLMRQDLLELVRAGVAMGLRFRLQSNGLLLAERARNVLSAGINDVLVSIDGPAEYHDRVRQKPGLHAAAEASVRRCADLGMNVRVNSVVRATNLPLLHDLFQRSAELGAGLHSFFFLTALGRGEALMDGLSATEYMHWAQRFTRSLSVSQRQRFRCQALGEGLATCRMSDRDKILVMADGAVFACVFLHPLGLAVGNVRRQSIDALWHSSPAWSAIDELAAEAGPSRPCPALHAVFSRQADRGGVSAGPECVGGCIRRYLEPVE